MSAYYYLIAGLPDIAVDDGKLSYSVDSIKPELNEQLSEKDKNLIRLFYYQYDNQILLQLLRGQEPSEKALQCSVLSLDELRQLIDDVRKDNRIASNVPQYMVRFLQQMDETENEAMRENRLASAYYDDGMACKNKAVAQWFELSLNINNLLAAFTARKYKMNVQSVVVGSNEVAECLRTSSARDFGLSASFDEFDELQKIADMTNAVERERAIDLLKWRWLDDKTFFRYFNIENVFAYLVRLSIIERWVALDKEKGAERFRAIIQSFKDDVKIPTDL